MKNKNAICLGRHLQAKHLSNYNKFGSERFLPLQLNEGDETTKQEFLFLAWSSCLVCFLHFNLSCSSSQEQEIGETLSKTKSISHLFNSANTKTCNALFLFSFNFGAF